MTEERVPEADAERVEVVREAVTMALYISLSLLAVLAALPSSLESEVSSVAATMGLAAIGLVFAHQVAFRLSTRLVSRGEIGNHASRLLGAQLIGGGLVTVLAVLPVLVFGPGALPVSVGLLVALVAVVGYLAARSVPVSRVRALVYVGGVVLVVSAVLGVKSLVGH